MSEHEPKVLAGHCVIALCCLLALVAHEPLAAPTNNTFPGFPRLPVVRVTAQPSVGVTLKWTKGEPPETYVTNHTTGSLIYAGLADAVMFSGLTLGSTNRFQAFNSNSIGMAFTPTLTTLATTQDLRCTIKLYTYLVTVPVRSNQLTSVMTSSNLVTWYHYVWVIQTNTTYSFMWTNDGGSRYFRSTSP